MTTATVSILPAARAEPFAADFLERIDDHWGRNGYLAVTDGRTFMAACPACRSKTSYPQGNPLRHPLTVQESGTPGGWDLCIHCECSEREIYAALDRTHEPDAASVEAAWLDGSPMDPAAVTVEPLPTVPGFPLMHRGTAAVVSGPTGAGRSSLFQACAYDAAREGLNVAYLGSEVTEPEFNARAADLAARRGDPVDDELRRDLARVRYLSLAATVSEAWADPGRWAAEAAERFDVFGFDPISAVASALDLDFDKSNADFVRWYHGQVQPLVDAGCAVLLLDNIGHATEARGRAKGASAKQDVADLTFSCALRANPQALLITARKVRTVRAAFSRGDQWLFDREGQQVTRQTPAAAGDEVWRPTGLMERVSRLLEENSPLGRNEIRAAIKSKADHVDAAVNALVYDEHVTVEHVGQKKLHHFTKPYREPGPTESQPGPGPGAVTGSHRVPPPVGGDSEPDPARRQEVGTQPSPDAAQAELDRLTAKFGPDDGAAA